MLKPFYVLTGLVLFLEISRWQTMPLWIHLLVFANVMLAGVFITLQVFSQISKR
jgi:uncharacterized protein (DUF983 family)